MEIKELNQAVKILESIKEIDKKILSIEKFAELVANGITKSSFDLKIQNLFITEPYPTQDEIQVRDVYTEMREAMSRSFNGFGGLIKDTPFKSKKENPDILSVDLTENETLQFLGLILGVKQRERKVLLQKLEAFGIV